MTVNMDDEQDAKKPSEENITPDDFEIKELQVKDEPETRKEEKPPAPEDEEIETVVRKSRVQESKQKKKKSLMVRSGIAAVILLLGYFIYGLFTPYKGGIHFGICKTFLERYVTFPSTLTLNSFEEFSDSIRIWHMHIDAFGQYRMEPIQCWFSQDQATGYLKLDRVTIKRREIEPEVIEQFNKSIPSIYANPPDLTLPYPLSDDLKNLHYEHNSFVKPIL